jgi:hypothetical protein
MLANMITLLLMFTVNPFWGPVNDAISVFWLLSFLPLAVLFIQVNRTVMGRGVAVATALAGTVAVLAFAVLQALLVLRLVRFEQTFSIVVALGGVIGAWLLVNGLLALKGQTLPGDVAWMTTLFGMSYVLAAAGYWTGGYESPLLWAGTAVGFLVGPLWGLRLGWLLLHGRVIPAALASPGA